MHKITWLCLSLLSLLITGCATAPQHVDLKPKLTTDNTHIGNNTPLKLVVGEQQDHQVIGDLGKGVPLIPARPLTETIRQALSENLTRKGFVLQDEATRVLNVQLEQFNYTAKPAGLITKATLNSRIKATASNAKGSLSKTYNLEKEKSTSFRPSPGQTTSWVNEQLSETLSDLLNDKALLETLAE